MGIREVAKRASVSTATVSRVLTGAAKVSPSSTTRVLRAIQALDFQANEAARALAEANVGKDKFGYRGEFLRLIDLTRALSTQKVR